MPWFFGGTMFLGRIPMHPVLARIFNTTHCQSFPIFRKPDKRFKQCVCHNIVKTATSLMAFMLCAYDASGSIVLMKFEADRVVVAADSRWHEGSWTDDSVCKVIEIEPHIFFFATGRTIAPDPLTKKVLLSSFS